MYRVNSYTSTSVDTGHHIMDKHDIKRETNYRQAVEEENTLM
jgi:hypothetical protein